MSLATVHADSHLLDSSIDSVAKSRTSPTITTALRSVPTPCRRLYAVGDRASCVRIPRVDRFADPSEDNTL